MTDINQKILYSNITAPPIGTTAPKTQSTPRTDSSGKTFDELLKERMLGGQGVGFSGHAAQRIQQRDINLSPQDMQRLDEGVKLAQAKGLGDTLILVDQTAFIVNARNNTVITAVDGEKIKGNVFTNIEGTVIV